MLTIVVLMFLTACVVFVALAAYGAHLEKHPERSSIGAELRIHYQAIVEESVATAYEAGMRDGRWQRVFEADQPRLPDHVATPDAVTDVIAVQDDTPWWQQAAGI